MYRGFLHWGRTVIVAAGLAGMAVAPAHAAEGEALSRALTMDTALSASTAAVVVAPAAPAAATLPQVAANAAASKDDPLLKLGSGDLVAVQVFGRPELSISAYVAENGNITLPLVGAVPVAGLSPADAGQRVADALKKGDFLVNPQVNITLQQFRSQQVSVLGEVHTPGRYALESKTNIFDLLAQAGGLAPDAADTGFLMRKDRSGETIRLPIDLRNLSISQTGNADYALKGGDSLYVPKAAQFYIYGEVRAPNRYKLEPGMTVVQAVTLGGGITDRGSERRIEVRRKSADGKVKTIDVRPSDEVEADDVIRVKERLF